MDADKSALIGKHVLVGLTYLDEAGDVTKQLQLHGLITKVSERTLSFDAPMAQANFQSPSMTNWKPRISMRSIGFAQPASALRTLTFSLLGRFIGRQVVSSCTAAEALHESRHWPCRLLPPCSGDPSIDTLGFLRVTCPVLAPLHGKLFQRCHGHGASGEAFGIPPQS